MAHSEQDQGKGPKPKDYKLLVQNVMITSPAPTIVVRDAIKQAGFDPDKGWIIILKVAGSRENVSLDTVIDLLRPGVEKLRLTPNSINNGEASQPRRRDFPLLPGDEAYLTASKYEWRTVLLGKMRWLLIDNYPLPDGYTVAVTCIAVLVPLNYPAAKLDMFYCYPALAKRSGAPIPKTEARVDIEGRAFQRWSRHGSWDPQTDTVTTHLTLVEASILREVGE